LVFFNNNELSKSTLDYTNLIKIDPNNFDANYMLGTIKISKANIIITKKNNTNDNNLYEKLRLQELELYNEALPFFEKALQINNLDLSLLDALKQVYYKVGDYKKSEDIKRQISQL
jgi:tetratricopeptide (TPR) repeat protein